MKSLKLLSLAALLYSGCAQFATVSETRPKFQPVRTTVGALVSAFSDLEQAQKEEERDPLHALGKFLAVAETAQKQLLRDPGDIAARNTYNFAVARVMGTIQEAKLDPWSKPLQVPAPGGDFLLTRKPDPRPQWNPALYDFTPADQFTIGGMYVTKRSTKEGIGAPTVAVGREANRNFTKDFTIPRIYYGVTVVIRFEGRRAVVELNDPLGTENVTVGGQTFPLAADYTVPIAVMLASTEPKKMGIQRMLNPEEYAATARVFRLQPYDPNKAVVLVVHGLMDSPSTWTPMINELRADPEIRQNYQFWFYSYPSGYPYPHSAAILRRELDEIGKRYPLRKKMVVIGHSMGGCISRLLITDSGDTIWMNVFKKRPEAVSMSPESKKLLTEGLIFQHRKEVGRVIFISAPLRGAELASNWLGRFASTLVKKPTKLLLAGNEALQITTFGSDEMKLTRIPNSVDTLAPNHRFVKLINTIPITPGIPYHVICGDRGKGGNKDTTPPVMSDGVVPYWSSHLEGAESELIVPSNHGAHQNEQAISEVKRILKVQMRK